MDYSRPGSSVRGIPQARMLCGLLFPSPGDLPKPGIKPGSPALQANSLPNEPCAKSCNVGCMLAIPGHKASLAPEVCSVSLLITPMALLVCFIICTDYFSMCPVIHTKYMSLCLYWRKTSFWWGGCLCRLWLCSGFFKSFSWNHGKSTDNSSSHWTTGSTTLWDSWIQGHSFHILVIPWHSKVLVRGLP